MFLYKPETVYGTNNIITAVILSVDGALSLLLLLLYPFHMFIAIDSQQILCELCL